MRLDQYSAPETLSLISEDLHKKYPKIDVIDIIFQLAIQATRHEEYFDLDIKSLADSLVITITSGNFSVHEDDVQLLSHALASSTKFWIEKLDYSPDEYAVAFHFQIQKA